MDRLSADSLGDILGRLPPRSIARSRCVRKAWRATVDDHRLLRAASQLPLSLDGVIYETQDPACRIPMFFSRRSTARRITNGLQYLDDNRLDEENWYWPMYDYCNGLLLLYRHVVNPATRQSARLLEPPCPCTATDCVGCGRDHDQNRYLVYDPTVSPHYQVFCIPQIPAVFLAGDGASPVEWPPSTYIIHAFSSETGCWKKKPLIREGLASGEVADFHAACESYNLLYYSAYWQGALYVRSEFGIILRINLSDDKYQMIKLPHGDEGVPRLGKSKKGVYCAVIHGQHTCEIWFLDESSGHMEWVLIDEIDLVSIHANYQGVHSDDDGPWATQSGGQKEWLVEDNTEEASPKDDFEWDSNDGNIVRTADLPRDTDHGDYDFKCLGFHPYQEIVLLHWFDETIAYHFDSSKVRYLGKMTCPCTEIEVSFAYAPCWMTGLPGRSEC